MFTSAATGQRVRPQLSVCNRAMPSAPACHDHDVFVGEKPVLAVVQTTMKLVVIPGFQNRLHDLRVPTNVFPQAPVVVGIIELSAVDRPY